MGAKCTIWAWRVGAPLIDRKQPMVLLTLLALADIANDRTGRLWASQSYIADHGHVSPRSVRSAMVALEDLGLIRTEPRTGASDVIWLCLSAVTIYERGPEPDEELTAWAKRRGGALRHDAPRTPGAGGGQTPAPTSAGGADKPLGTQDRNLEEANASVGAADAARHAFDGFNLMASQAGLPLAQKLTDQRRRAIKARLKDCDGQNGWTEALERVARSPFLTGKTDANFRATLDFILQPSSFTKLMEGRYEDRHDRGSPASTTIPDRSVQRSAARIDAMVEGARIAATSGRRRWWVEAGVVRAPDRDQPHPAGGGVPALAGPGEPEEPIIS